MDFYFKVCYEGAWTASLIPLGNDTTYAAMLLFGGYNMHLALILATAGAALGQLFNYGLGYAMLHQRGKYSFNVSEHWYKKVSGIFNKYCVFLLLFSWAPLCNLMLPIAGFTRAPLKVVMPLVTVGYLLHYGLQLV